jgi:uncharacterized flavoprotein (TIGR03862 family)
MKNVAIIGGGPAGLMAAEVLSKQGIDVSIFEAMPTVGRKFLLAGKSGLNITHSEPHEKLRARYDTAREFLTPALDEFTALDIRNWALSLGVETFVGTSGRIFPTAMKASPLLRSWLARLKQQGVRIQTRHRFTGFSLGGVALDTPDGVIDFPCDAVLLALGGASWPKLGSNAAWVPLLASKQIEMTPFRAANCGFDVNWSENFRQKFAGSPVKSVTAKSDSGTLKGEFVISQNGVEGSLIYAHSAMLRDRLDAGGQANLVLDLMPDRSADRIAKDLGRQKSKESFSSRLRKGAGLDGVKAALVRECLFGAHQLSAAALATAIKALPLSLVRPRPIAEAISSAGGIRLSALDHNYMLRAMPGVFAAGEMLDWEAPTGGFLLTACLASGQRVAMGIMDFLDQQQTPASQS